MKNVLNKRMVSRLRTCFEVKFSEDTSGKKVGAECPDAPSDWSSLSAFPKNLRRYVGRWLEPENCHIQEKRLLMRAPSGGRVLTSSKVSSRNIMARIKSMASTAAENKLGSRYG